MVAQEVVLKEPLLVRKMVLAGTGPAGAKRAAYSCGPAWNWSAFLPLNGA